MAWCVARIWQASTTGDTFLLISLWLQITKLHRIRKHIVCIQIDFLNKIQMFGMF